MDAISEHSFKLDLDIVEPAKPLPYVTKRKRTTKVSIPETYPKYEVEFYDVLSSCAEYIDKISDRDVRNKYNKELSKIFLIRHKPSLMSMFMKLVNSKAN